MADCTHLDQIRDVTPSGDGCVECLATGGVWRHLRLCLTCGHVGCCDESVNQHARKHAAATDHQMMRTFEDGEDWVWCFADELFWESIGDIVR